MPPIAWTPAMSVGVKALDDDHKVLVGLINQLDKAMEDDDAYDVVRVIIDGLRDYTEHHFVREEKMMRAHGYPGVVKHCAEHRAIERKVERLRDGYSENIIAGFDRRLMAFMRDWLTRHILRQDMAYVPFMRRRKPGTGGRAGKSKTKAKPRARRAPRR